MAKSKALVEKHGETGEVIAAPLKPSLSEGLQEIADWYFMMHSQILKEIGVNQIIVCEDGEVFYDNVKGANAAINHCRAKAIGSEQFKQN